MAFSALATARLKHIPAVVWALGFVSMPMDVSSEMIHAVLPVYLVTVLGVSTLIVGIIEGIAEATAAIVKVFSGALSDWLGKRKGLAALGYGRAAVSKPAFPMAATVSWLIAARFIDRVAKGIRGAPRDALIADLSPPDIRGASFGLRQSLDTVGAFLGPLLAIVFMWFTANSFTTVFWIAVIPAFLSFALIAFTVREPERPASLRIVKAPLGRAELVRLDAVGHDQEQESRDQDEPAIDPVGEGPRRHGSRRAARHRLWHFNLLTGLALLAASIAARALWDVMGPKSTFLAGAAFAALAVAGLLARGA